LVVRKQIDILVQAARKGSLVVEKATNLLWTQEELLEARESRLLQEESALLAPDERTAVSGPFPGCCQRGGATADREGYRPIGQTRHFVIFAADPPAPSR
jgi:hypothetical protein